MQPQLGKGAKLMSSAEELFKRLVSFKVTDASLPSPQQQLLDYCTRTFGSVERLHVDFKTKSDAASTTLGADDKKNLAKAVSGFANAGGGVLIWGMEDRTLIPRPIAAIQDFLSYLLELAPQVTDPVVQGIDGEWLPSDEEAGNGFALILIPESLLPPHRVILSDKKVKNHYYTRSGGSFIVASHTQLEDMFGRRPKPNIELHKRMVVHSEGGGKHCVWIILGIMNSGRGAAKSPFMSIKVDPPYKISRFGIDGNRNFGLKELPGSVGLDEKKYGASTDIVIHSGVYLDVTAIEVKVDLRESHLNIQDLVVSYKIAAEGVRFIERQEIIKGTEIWDFAHSSA